MYIKNSLIRNKICLKKKKYKNYSCYTQKRFAGGSEIAIILPISAYYKIDWFEIKKKKKINVNSVKNGKIKQNKQNNNNNM